MDDPRQQNELKGAYQQSTSKSKENNEHYQSGSRQKMERRLGNPKKTVQYNI